MNWPLSQPEGAPVEATLHYSKHPTSHMHWCTLRALLPTSLTRGVILIQTHKALHF